MLWLILGAVVCVIAAVCVYLSYTGSEAYRERLRAESPAYLAPLRALSEQKRAEAETLIRDAKKAAAAASRENRRSAGEDR